MKAGARSAEIIIKMLLNEKIDTDAVINDGAVYSRFDQSVCIQEGNVAAPLKGIIFDLDDTLYNEKQYIKSGFKAVGEYLGRRDAADELWKFFENGEPAIDAYLSKIDQPSRKEECLKIYREHKPLIEFNNGVSEMLENLRTKGIKIGIITDGRPSGQRKKIKALGLEKMVDDIIITDELGGEQFRKPCDLSYRIIQRRWGIPFEQIMYVGDNVDKDFQAPRQLGMQWKLVDNDESIYKKRKA